MDRKAKLLDMINNAINKIESDSTYLIDENDRYYAYSLFFTRKDLLLLKKALERL